MHVHVNNKIQCEELKCENCTRTAMEYANFYAKFAKKQGALKLIKKIMQWLNNTDNLFKSNIFRNNKNINKTKFFSKK